MTKSFILTITCTDTKGIVANVSNFIASLQGNIIHSDQFSTDHTGGVFLMRVVFDIEVSKKDFIQGFEIVAKRFDMSYNLTDTSVKKRMGILVSKQDHCLVDLLWRWESGDLDLDIPFIISNHLDAEIFAKRYNIPFYYFDINKDNQVDQEEEILKLLEGEVDFIVLARYMRILGKKFLDTYPNKIINIHHSFLPAFIGANPYQKAFTRGVKLIGATAHYATSELDEGPIIFQDVTRVGHKDSVKDLVRKGKDIERQVLAQAVRWHNEDRVLVYKNKTVVFD